MSDDGGVRESGPGGGPPGTTDGGGGTSRSGDTAGASTSFYDSIRTPAEHRRLSRLPALVGQAVALVHRAGGRVFWASVAVQVFAGVAVTAQLLAARLLLDEVIAADQADAGVGPAVPALLVFVGLTTLMGLATAAGRETSTLLAELVSREATGRVLDVATAVDLEAYEAPGFHDRLERARFNANNRPVMTVNGLLGLFSALVATVGITVGLLLMHPLLVPVTLLAVVPLWLAESRNGRAWYRFTVEMTPLDRERIYLANTLAGKDRAKEVRAYGIGPFLHARWRRLYDRRIAAVTALVRRRLGLALLASAAASLAAAATVAAVFWLLLSDRMDLAAAGAAVLGITYLGQRLRTIAVSAGQLHESALFVEDYFDFLALSPTQTTQAAPATPTAHTEPTTPAAATESTAPAAPDPSPGSPDGRALGAEGGRAFGVRDVSFTYPGSDQPALDRVSLEVGPGEVVAVVGDNGSGKSTLAKVLGLLYRPAGGVVYRGGRHLDPSGPSADHDRRQIAMVFQDFGQYWLSARDNITLGDIDRGDDVEAAEEAARAVGAHDFLAALPRGYDTVLSRLMEGGRDLSIGQWQRVALARALFRDAALVILDEPTASLDAAAEARLFDSIAELAADRSVLLISHRFSSVRSADRIYVLHHGRLVEHGTHAQLMEAQGRYAAMFTLQASAYVTPDPDPDLSLGPGPDPDSDPGPQPV